jgi:predicted nucleotidyltransferase
MTPKLWQEKPRLSCSDDVLEIVQFGSSLIEDSEPNDVDVAVIFHKIPLKEQLKQAQDIKKQLQKITEKEIHISAYDLYSLLDGSNFAREGIIFYGRSIITGDYFAKRMGLTPRLRIHYSLKDMKKKDKVRFNYALNGKSGSYGLLRKYGGKLLTPGLVEIAPEYEKIFTEAVKEMTENFSLEKVLVV